MAINNILVIGNRDLSRTIVSTLIASSPETTTSSYRVSVLTYPSQTPYLPPNIPAGLVEHKVSDFSRASLESTFAGIDLVICTIAGSDFDFQVRLSEAMVAAGVRRFIPHEFGHDTFNSAVEQRVSSTFQRRSVLNYLNQSSSADPQFQWKAIAMGCILDSMLLSGDLGFDLQWQSATIHGTGAERFAVSSLQRVGAVVVSLVRRWDELSSKRYFYVAGALTTANEILACLEKCTGSVWSVGYSAVKECVREGNLRIERGYPDAGMFLLERSVFYDEDLDAVHAFKYLSSNDLLNLNPEAVDEIVHKAYHDFEQRGKPTCGCA
ncbi:isoflavone reductase family protein [Lojkania enalia]|uniref:Isoflavone reductase family protein n=1 Tax=Lojkania enalia TaxID=147567 RepID=A0A9P4N1N0_9PLEO|nr:isoflavone reductase family protein [Didymosphaeria enalia]